MDNDIINLIFELFINFYQGVVFVSFCYKLLTPTKNQSINKIAYCSVIIMMFLAITIMNYLYISFAYIETVVFFAIMMTYCIFFFTDKFFVRILVTLSINLLYSVLSFGINYFFSAVIDSDYNYLMSESTVYRYIYVVLVNLIFLVFLYITYKLLKNNFYIIKKREKLLILSMPILSIVVGMLTFLVSSNRMILNRDRIILGLVSTIILLFTFLNFYLINNISKKYELKKKSIIANKEKELYRIQILNSQKYLNNISEIKHNIRNQLLCVENLIDQKKYLEAKKICISIDNSINANIHFYKTGNVYLDAILNIVKEKANTNSINLKVECYNNLNFVDGDDLAVVIGNLADNAIEALKNEQKKELKIEIIQKGVYAILSVQNFCTKSVLETNPKLITNKQDKSNHGFGLSSVKKIIKKYKGEISYFEENNCFYVNITIEIPNITE